MIFCLSPTDRQTDSLNPVFNFPDDRRFRSQSGESSKQTGLRTQRSNSAAASAQDHAHLKAGNSHSDRQYGRAVNSSRFTIWSFSKSFFFYFQCYTYALNKWLSTFYIQPAAYKELEINPRKYSIAHLHSIFDVLINFFLSNVSLMF